jgi:hypothetical protein
MGHRLGCAESLGFFRDIGNADWNRMKQRFETTPGSTTGPEPPSWWCVSSGLACYSNGGVEEACALEVLCLKTFGLFSLVLFACIWAGPMPF